MTQKFFSHKLIYVGCASKKSTFAQLAKGDFQMNQKENNLSVPIWEKYALTIAEAARYFGVGENRIRELIKEPGCAYVLYVGKKALIKRKEFEKELSTTTYI